MRWWLSQFFSRFGAKSSCERKPKRLSGLTPGMPLLHLVAQQRVLQL